MKKKCPKIDSIHAMKYPIIVIRSKLTKKKKENSNLRMQKLVVFHAIVQIRNRNRMLQFIF